MMTREVPDVMQVCENGHVITDLLYTHPDAGRTHCDRCGAATLERCPTCAAELPGAIPVPGLVPVGDRRPPQHCPTCGAAFPWTEQRGRSHRRSAVATLEGLLRRLPNAIRELRWRHGDRPAFCVRDDYDLEDLLRALLPLHFDDVRPESRTPHYAAATRTDFLLAREGIAVCLKFVPSGADERQFAPQFAEDITYYRGRPSCLHLVVFFYDPEQLLASPRRLEACWRVVEEDWQATAVIAS
jgi:hypothetical protein